MRLLKFTGCALRDDTDFRCIHAAPTHTSHKRALTQFTRTKMAHADKTELTAYAKSACLGVKSVELLVPKLMQSPLTDNQKTDFIVFWLKPLAEARVAAQLAKNVRLIFQLALLFCHISGCLCHALSIVFSGTSSMANSFNVAGIVIHTIAAGIYSLQQTLFTGKHADFKELNDIAGRYEAMGIRWLAKLESTKAPPTAEEWADLILRFDDVLEPKFTPKNGKELGNLSHFETSVRLAKVSGGSPAPDDARAVSGHV